MYTLIAFLIAILLLVSLHELGHLIAARLCGIKVRRFCVGFGAPIVRKTWRNIEWCIAPIPLGGYVKMLDTREGNVAPADEPFAFDKQSPIKRIIVVAAGPLTNLALAIALYSGSFYLGGITEIKPYIGSVAAPSIASQAGFAAGDQILSVNGVAVHNWREAQTQMVLNLEAGDVRVAVQTADGKTAERTIRASGSPEARAVAAQQSDLGMTWQKLSNKIGAVLPNSPAEQAGLQAGDQIIAINNQPTPSWQDWRAIVEANAGRNLEVAFLRSGKEMRTTLLPASEETPDKSQIIGRIGVRNGIDEAWAAQVRTQTFPSAQEAFLLASERTFSYVGLTINFFGKLLTGNASLKHLSGPVTIADVAGQSAKLGWQAYIEFLALVSTSLGIMNLLPIPMLDGGHLLYYTAELIRGKPLSQRLQELGLKFGFAIMLAMMILAFFNDITRLIG